MLPRQRRQTARRQLLLLTRQMPSLQLLLQNRQKANQRQLPQRRQLNEACRGALSGCREPYNVQFDDWYDQLTQLGNSTTVLLVA